MVKNLLTIGSFNVRGLNDESKQELLTKDIVKYKLDICCLQETKIQETVDQDDICKNRFIILNAENKYYGLGFIVSAKWKNNILKYWKVSERIAVIQLKLKEEEYVCENNLDSDINLLIRKKTSYKIVKNRKKDIKLKLVKEERKNVITIINVYAPTSELVEKDRSELDRIYAQLEKILKEHKKNSLILIAGDFNAKIGKYRNDNECVGRFSTGKRNSSGQELIDFCGRNRLFISNSAFEHPVKHRTTWSCKREINNKIVNTYNQIDYILCQQNRKQSLIDARSYNGTLTSTDHSLVICKLEIPPYKLYRNKKQVRNRTINKKLLSTNRTIRNDFQHCLEYKLENLDQEKINSEVWEDIVRQIHSAAEETIGYDENNKKKVKAHDPEIETLSEKQRKLRLQIDNSMEVNDNQRLKKQRNETMRKIKQKLLENKEKEISEKLNEINNMKDDSKMFKSAKLLYQKKFQNPIIHDKKGKFVTQPTKIYEIIKDHFYNHFNDPNEKQIKPFIGVKRKLNKPITIEEVQKCSKKLNNNRAAGYDEIPAEYIKYGPVVLHLDITNVVNNIFEKHEEIPTNRAILLTIPKPNKPKGPTKNLRPINLLPSIRKILSLITLNRIQPKVDNYVSQSQAAYRQFRSTSDCIWAYRFIIAKVQNVNETIYVTGIDMSSAFDTIRRKKLIEIVKTFLDEDEVRILQYLLSNTTLEIKMNNVETEMFKSNIGAPQGDALSGNLFTIYFEYALRKVREKLKGLDVINKEHSYSKQLTTTIPEEIIYADDADFITDNIERKKRINVIIKDMLLQDNLKVNDDKTEHTTLIRKNINTKQIAVERKKEKENIEPWRDVIKLGSKLGDREDIIHRKQLSNNAMDKMNNIWFNSDKIKVELRIKMYKSLIKPILLYNSSTWGLGENDKKDLNAFHRKQLRRILNVKYPDRMKNKEVYNKTNEIPITLEILAGRWRLFGHTLRMNDESPAQKAMFNYFTPSMKPKFRGRPRVTLPSTLNRDLEQNIDKNSEFYRRYEISNIKNVEDLEKLKVLAKDRKEWKNFSEMIYKTAEAETSNSEMN